MILNALMRMDDFLQPIIAENNLLLRRKSGEQSNDVDPRCWAEADNT